MGTNAAAPTSLLPSAANDSRPVRNPAYQTKAGAVAHAIRVARVGSPDRAYRAVEFVADTYQAVTGGNAYRVVLGAIDWEVCEVSAVELARLVQAGIRSAVETHEHRAKAHELAAGVLRLGALHAQHLRYAAEERATARELETKLVVSAVSL